MTDPWAERIASHPINNLLATLSERLVQATNNPEMRIEAVQHLRRAQAVMEELTTRLKNTRPELISLSTLNTAVSHLQQAQNNFEAFFNNADEAHLRNADQHIDNLLVDIRPLFPLPFRKESQVAVKAAKAYADQLGGLESAVSSDLEGLRGDIDGLEQAVQDAQGRLEGVKQAAGASAQQIKAELEAKVAEVRAEIDRQQGRLDEAISQHQAVFSEAQERRIKDFNESQQARETAFEEQVEVLMNGTRSRFDNLAETAEASVTYLQEQEARANEIVGVTAATATAGAYVKEADDQRLQADRWRLVALGILFLLIVVSPLAFLIDPLDTDASAVEVITYTTPRLPVALFLYVVYYATRQSGDHRQRERNARRRALELTTFRPFLAELPEEEQHRLTGEASTRYFTGDESPPSGEKPSPTP